MMQDTGYRMHDDDWSWLKMHCDIEMDAVSCNIGRIIEWEIGKRSPYSRNI